MFFRHNQPGIGRKRAYRLGETGPGMLDKKGNSRTVRAAAEAMVKLLGGTDSKRGGFFVVKRTEAKQVGPTFSQLHVLPDYINDIYPGKQVLYK